MKAIARITLKNCLILTIFPFFEVRAFVIYLDLFIYLIQKGRNTCYSTNIDPLFNKIFQWTDRVEMGIILWFNVLFKYWH